MTPDRVFEDREDAGRQLAARLSHYAGRKECGRPGAAPGRCARRIRGRACTRCPFDLLEMVRKLGLPGQEELAMGAIASGGVRVLNDELVRMAGVPPIVIERIANEEKRELERREREYRGDRAPLEVEVAHRHPCRRRSRHRLHAPRRRRCVDGPVTRPGSWSPYRRPRSRRARSSPRSPMRWCA